MTDVQKAMLGDKEAEERLTERGELLTCWRCGSDAELKELQTGGKPIYAVVCKNNSCGAYGCAHKSKEESTLYWNTRPQLLTKEQIEALERMEKEGA